MCLDVFAISFGVFGEMRLTVAQRIRITVLLMAFETGMPLVGMALATPLTHLTGVAANLRIDGAPANAYQVHAASLGHAADVFEQTLFGRYVDPVIVPLVVGAIGIWMLDDALNDDDDDDEAGKVRAMVTSHGLSVIGLGLATSVDDLVIGFTLAFNAYYLPMRDVLAAIVIQALVAITLGQYLGWRVRNGRLRLNSGRVIAASKLTAGGVLIALAAIVLLLPELTTHVIPHLYHPRYIPPLPHPAVGASTQ
ncbi:MAG TPA: manganese efflux pump [Trebonia sp.]|nr:manganese efflux pump [Trebonia sp.]